MRLREAAVRDLRNHFAAVAKWIEDGESVTITRNGAPFALLSPALRPAKRKRVDWKARTARYKPVGKVKG